MEEHRTGVGIRAQLGGLGKEWGRKVRDDERTFRESAWEETGAGARGKLESPGRSSDKNRTETHRMSPMTAYGSLRGAQ